MSIEVQRRRGTTAEHNAFVGAVGEITVNTTTGRLHLHDGVTLGGIPIARLDEPRIVSTVIKTATYNILAADKDTTFVANSASAINFNLPAASSFTLGSSFYARNINTGDVTIVLDGADTFESGITSLVLSKGDHAAITRSGATSWRAVVTRFEGHIEPETTIASAATTDIGASNTEAVSITGTTTITSLGTRGRQKRIARFTGILTLTHNATTLILPSGASITTAAGDVAEFVSDAAGNWRCISYTRASGQALVTPGAVVVPVLPGGRLTFQTLVPIPVTDQVAATVLYYTPTTGNVIPIWNGSADAYATFAELSLTLNSNSGHTGYHQSGKNFDAFAALNGGSAVIGTGPTWDAGAVAGSNILRGTGAGSTELELHNGLWRNKNSITLRIGPASGDLLVVAARQATYLGSFRATANGQGTDSKRLALLYNAYNQADRLLYHTDTTTSWVWSTAGWQQARATATNQIEVLLGLAGGLVDLDVMGLIGTTYAAGWAYGAVGIGLDSVTVDSSTLKLSSPVISVALGTPQTKYKGSPGLGYHYLSWLEYGTGAGGTDTWYGNSGTALWKQGMAGSMIR